jgi:hypothetical protein
MQANGDGSKFATDQRVKGMKARHRKNKLARGFRFSVPSHPGRKPPGWARAHECFRLSPLPVANLRLTCAHPLLR